MKRSDRISVVIGTSVAVAVAMIAQQIASKAVRDAFFLSVYEAEVLARVMTVSSIASVVAVLAVMRLYTRFAPRRLVPLFFLVSAALFVTEWLLIAAGRDKVAALVLFLHTSSFGAISISGFWAVINERFDPHTAKRVIGRVASGATLGGLVGGVAVWQAADVVPIPALLVGLAFINGGCAVGVRLIGHGQATAPPVAAARDATAERTPAKPRTAPWHLFEDSPYLRQVALVVVLIAFGTAGVDYLFKAQAASSFTDQQGLVSFFALFYLGTGIAAFVLQNAVASRLLGRVGIAATVATLPLVLVTLGPVALFVPGLFSMSLLRGGAATIESSTYRSGYELLYTPLAPEAKRPAKTLIDVGGDKLGAAAGAACAVFLIGLVPTAAPTILLAVAVACGLGAIVLSRMLARGYIESLASSLRSGLIDPDTVSAVDSRSRDVVEQTVAALDRRALGDSVSPGGASATLDTASSLIPVLDAPAQWSEPLTDPDLASRLLLAVESGEPSAISWVLRQRTEIPPSWVPQLVPLLGKAEMRAVIEPRLRQSAPRYLGALVDALLDSSVSLGARLAVADVLSGVPTQRCASSLLAALRLEPLALRVAVARTIAAVAAKSPAISIPAATVFSLAQAEADALNRSIFNNDPRQLAASTARTRQVGLSVGYCVLLLSLAVDRRSLLLAIQALDSDDRRQRGTGLEYVESVLPENLKAALSRWLAVRSVATEVNGTVGGHATSGAVPDRLSLGVLMGRLEVLRQQQLHQ